MSDHEEQATLPFRTTEGASRTIVEPRGGSGGRTPRVTPAVSRRQPEDLVELPTVEREYYGVEGVYARGGLGLVLKGRDRRLHRPVAIKQLIESSPQTAARFVREARVSARLQHPSIVPVYEAGRWPNGEPFYTMKLITGRSLKEAVESAPTLDERLALLPHVLAAADAMAYAHTERIIHRDLKPSNILLGPFGETVVIDWGLAKDLNEPGDDPDAPGPTQPPDGQDLTMVGTVIGTPEYMPPEQARGEPVDERADVYALGSILYHVLTGRPPYRKTKSLDTVAAVVNELPPPLEHHQSGIPIELETIVRKAMERESKDRYPSARELAEDLRRFQTGQLVSAHEYSRTMLLVRWVNRHRAPLGVALACVLILMVGAALGFEHVVGQRNKADAARDMAERRSNELTLVQARTALDRDPTATLAWLKTYPAEAGHGWHDVRDLALDAWTRRVARHVFVGGDPSFIKGAFSPDGRWFASVGQRKTLLVRDVASGAIVRSQAYRGALHEAVFSPDGQLVAYAEQDGGGIVLWDLESGRTWPLSGDTGLLSVTFSPDGRWVLAVTTNHKVCLWSVGTGEMHCQTGHAGLLSTVHFSPDSRWALFAGTDRTVRLWQVGTPQVQQLSGHRDNVRAIAISPDSKTLVTGSEGGEVWRWDLERDEGHLLAQYPGIILSAAFSPGGQQVAIGSSAGMVRLIDLKTGVGQVMGMHRGEVEALAFSPSGRHLASGSIDRTVRLWALDTGESWALQGHGSAIYWIAFSPDGRLLASTSHDKTSRLWEVPEGGGRVMRGHEDDVSRLAFSPDGRYVASASRDHTVRLWEVATGRSREVVRHEDIVLRVAFSPDGALLASVGVNSAVHLWDLGAKKGRPLRSFEGRVWDLSFAPAGRLLAVAGSGGLVWLWDGVTGAERTLTGCKDNVRALAFAPTGRLLAAADGDGTVWLWDVATGQGRRLSGHTAQASILTFSSDGRLLASAGSDGPVWLWQTDSGRGELRGGASSKLYALAFSPDNRTLVGGAEDGAILLWSTTSATTRRLIGHRDRIYDLAFSPDGQHIASSSRDGTLRLWGFPSMICQRLFRHDQDSYVLDLAFSPDGRLLASSGVDRAVHLWPVRPQPTPPTAPRALLDWMGSVSSAVIAAGSPSGNQPGTP